MIGERKWDEASRMRQSGNAALIMIVDHACSHYMKYATRRFTNLSQLHYIPRLALHSSVTVIAQYVRHVSYRLGVP